MGHIGNPVAFRLNYSKKWTDIWFSKNLYYPEFLNKMLNIRDYLYYFFTKKSMLKSGNCLSHLNIIKVRTSYIIKVYVYSIDLEKLSYDFINKIYNLYYSTLKLYTGKISGVTKEVLKEKLAKKRLINELQNSDLFAFIFVYYFFDLFVKRNSNQYLEDNTFLANTPIKYSNKLIKKYMNYIFFKLKMCSVRKNRRKLIYRHARKRYLLRRLKIIEQRKKQSLIWGFSKAQITEANKLRLKKGLGFIKIKPSKKILNKEDKAYLAYLKEVENQITYWKQYKKFFSNYKTKTFRLRDLNRKIYKSLNDNLWQTKYKSERKLNFYDFFFLFIKKNEVSKI